MHCLVPRLDGRSKLDAGTVSKLKHTAVRLRGLDPSPDHPWMVGSGPRLPTRDLEGEWQCATVSGVTEGPYRTSIPAPQRAGSSHGSESVSI